MSAVLHLIKSADADLARAAIEHQHRTGATVTVALLHGARAPALPDGVRVVRVPDEVSWDGLLELVFAADHVVTW